MKITYKRLPNKESKEYYHGIFESLIAILNGNNPDYDYGFVGKHDQRGGYYVSVEHNQKHTSKRLTPIFNSWNELIAYCQGVIDTAFMLRK